MVHEIDSFVGVSYKPVRFENMEELYDATGDTIESFPLIKLIDVNFLRDGRRLLLQQEILLDEAGDANESTIQRVLHLLELFDFYFSPGKILLGVVGRQRTM